MLERVKPFKAALAVRTIAAGDTDAADQGRYCQAVWRQIAGGCGDLRSAAGMHSGGVGARPVVSITIATEDQGFAFVYFDTGCQGLARIVLGGLTAEPFEPPMPITPCPHAAVMAAQCGMVRLHYTLASMMSHMHRHASESGAGQWRPGWEFDLHEFMGLVRQATPGGFDLLAVPDLDPERN